MCLLTATPRSMVQIEDEQPCVGGELVTYERRE